MRAGILPGRGILPAMLAALLCAGCGAAAAGDPGSQRRSHPVRTPSPLPAEAAGGACQLLNFDKMRTALGLDFSIAASSDTGNTFSCVLQGERAPYPDLRLMVTLTKADTSVFRSTFQPRGATNVSGLGTTGYTATVAADPRAGTGTGTEVGWLAAGGRVMMLRITLAAGAPAAQATALNPKLVAVARAIDQATS